MASPSFHSFVVRSNVRGVEATVKFATGAPDGGEAQFRVGGQVPDQGDDGFASHVWMSFRSDVGLMTVPACQLVLTPG